MGQRASSESAVSSEASSAIALVRRNLSRADDRPTLTYTEATVPQIQRIDQFHQKVPLLEPDRPYPLRNTLDDRRVPPDPCLQEQHPQDTRLGRESFITLSEGITTEKNASRLKKSEPIHHHFLVFPEHVDRSNVVTVGTHSQEAEVSLEPLLRRHTVKAGIVIPKSCEPSRAVLRPEIVVQLLQNPLRIELVGDLGNGPHQTDALLVVVPPQVGRCDRTLDLFESQFVDCIVSRTVESD